MIFNYKAIDNTGAERVGVIEAINADVAINSLQRRNLIVSEIHSQDESSSFLSKNITWFQHVSNKETVVLSRQVAILFGAQVSALRVFRLLSAENENVLLRKTLTVVADDIQGGSSISKAMSKHPAVFSNFYVNMVKSGEESGKLDQTFMYLADYLERSYEVTSKAKNALIYPAFVISVFIAVMVLMFTMIIPKISDIILQSGQEIPVYTKVVIGISDFFVHYGIFLGIGLVVFGFFLYRYTRTPKGKESLDEFKLKIPYVGMLYRRLYLSRIADNMCTMLASGIAMIKGLEITAAIVGNEIYKRVLLESLEAVKTGSSLSEALGVHEEIPGIMIQMSKVGEETGELGNILKTMSRFYQREVMNAVDTLVDMIEPVMIVLLGVGVGILLASVLIPIYNMSSAF